MIKINIKRKAPKNILGVFQVRRKENEKQFKETIRSHASYITIIVQKIRFDSVFQTFFIFLYFQQQELYFPTMMLWSWGLHRREQEYTFQNTLL